jgi:hypothetical protein
LGDTLKECPGITDSIIREMGIWISDKFEAILKMDVDGLRFNLY